MPWSLSHTRGSLRARGRIRYSNGQVTALDRTGASAINDSGQILYGLGGINNQGQTAQGGTLFTGGLAVPLGDFGFPQSTEARAINNIGQVAGTSADAQDVFRPFLYTSGHIQDLGLLPGVTAAQANGINDAGEVVGGSMSGSNRAFLFSNGHLTDLGTLGGSDGVAYDINNHGQVVGDATTATGDGHAFLYSGGKMLDLNEFIPPNTGWVLRVGTSINDAGQIVGWGSHDGVEFQGFLLTPITTPEPATLLAIAALCAGCGLRSWRRHRRGAATAVFAADS